MDTGQNTDDEAQLWMRIASRLALDNAETQLHDRKLKTEVLHTTIIKIANWFLTDTDVPEAQRTLTNAVSCVMQAFGAKPSLTVWTGGSERIVWAWGEVSERTVWDVLKEAEEEALEAAWFWLLVCQLQLRTGLDVWPKRSRQPK